MRTLRQAEDVSGLLKLIKTIVYQFETHTSIYEALDEAKKNYYLYYQGPKTSNSQHVKNLQNMVEVIEYHVGSVTDDQALVRYKRDLEAHLPEDKRSSEETLKRRAKDKMLGVALIRRADIGRLLEMKYVRILSTRKLIPVPQVQKIHT